MIYPDILKGPPQQLVASALGMEPTEGEIATPMKAVANTKAVGSDGLPVELLKLGLPQDRSILLELHRLTTLLWCEEKFPTQLKDTATTVLHNKGDKTKCANFRGISLVSHAIRLRAYCVAKRLSPKEQCVFRPDWLTTYMMFVVRRLQKIRRKAQVSIFMGLVNLQKACDTVDRTFLLLQVLTRIGVRPQMIAIIRQSQDGMRACVRPDYDVCVDWFDMEQGLQ